MERFNPDIPAPKLPKMEELLGQYIDEEFPKYEKNPKIAAMVVSMRYARELESRYLWLLDKMVYLAQGEENMTKKEYEPFRRQLYGYLHVLRDTADSGVRILDRNVETLREEMNKLMEAEP